MTGLQSEAQRLAPAGTYIEAGRIDALRGALFPEEETAIQAAVLKRQSEFRAGRTVARKALAQLGLAAAPIGRAADRSPVWPDGVTGSISHTTSHAVAMVGRDADFLGLGVDIEPDTAIGEAVTRKILRPEELMRPDLAKLMFSIKEAGFKALYPAFRRFIGFEDARTVLSDTEEGVARIEMLLDNWDGPRVLPVRWCKVDGHFLTVVALARA